MWHQIQKLGRYTTYVVTAGADIPVQELYPFVHASVHKRGVWLKLAHVTLYIQNALLLQPEWPINVASFLRSCAFYITHVSPQAQGNFENTEKEKVSNIKQFQNNDLKICDAEAQFYGKNQHWWLSLISSHNFLLILSTHPPFNLNPNYVDIVMVGLFEIPYYPRNGMFAERTRMKTT